MTARPRGRAHDRGRPRGKVDDRDARAAGVGTGAAVISGLTRALCG